MEAGGVLVQKGTRKRAAATAQPPYTSRIIKASALLDDTKAVLSHWDTSASVADNIDRIRRENILAKASRSRVEDGNALIATRGHACYESTHLRACGICSALPHDPSRKPR